MTSKKNFDSIIRVNLILIGFFFCFTGLGADDEKLQVDVKINGKPAKLIFDTGASAPTLFEHTAKSLDLKVNDWPTNAEREFDSRSLPYSITEPCKLTLWNREIDSWFYVVAVPEFLSPGFGGVLGWSALKQNVVQVDALNGKFEFLEHLPELKSNWLEFQLKTNFSTLVFEIPNQLGEQKNIAVDTGSDSGISLSPQRWREWTQSHPNRAKTLVAYFMPGAGMVVREVTWADEITFGKLRLTHVPVEEANTAEIAIASPGYEATFGLAALKRVDFVVDGEVGVLCLHPKNAGPAPYRHNRIGAVFTPDDLQKPVDLIAHVMEGSPAYEAGVRSGDVLIEMDHLEISKWRAGPALKINSRLQELASGTKVSVTLKRGEKQYHTTIVARDLIGP